jgi:hypothetical protein
MSEAHEDTAVPTKEAELSSASQQDDDKQSAEAKKSDDNGGHGDGSKPVSDDQINPLQIMYDKVATQHDRIDDFRAKLLALLPIATGIGLFALVKDAPTRDVGFFLAIGIFGAISSVGLFVHELRGITECYMLIELGAALEEKLTQKKQKKMKLPGAFSGRSSWGFAWYVMPNGTAKKNKTIVNRETAALIIYPTVIAAWVFVAGWPYLGLVWSLALSFLALAVAVWSSWTSLKLAAEEVLKYKQRLSSASIRQKRIMHRR